MTDPHPRLLRLEERLRVEHEEPARAAAGEAALVHDKELALYQQLRVRDEDRNWRIIYRLDHDAIVIVGVFAKTTRQTPKAVVDDCQRRLRAYDEETRNAAKRATKQGELP